MASLVLGAAGAFVGSFFGPLGTSIGWAIGSSIGSSLSQKGQNGPRLTDLKLQGSAYGTMIPFIYGTMREAGQVIWQTDLVEHKQKTGGKGGPTTTTYTYSASFAIDLCQGPILGVLRIWADSRLVYDVATSAPTDFPFTLYVGNETQLPDPTMEATEGVGNVPANRGVAYVVFTDLYLTDYGNRIPNFTFEVYTATDDIPWQYSLFTPINNQSIAGPNGEGPISAALENGNLVLSRWTGGSSSMLYEEWTYDLLGNAIDSRTVVGPVLPAPTPGGSLQLIPCSNNPHISFGHMSATGNFLNAGWYYDGAPTSTLKDYHDSAIYAVYSNNAVFTVAGLVSATLGKWSAPGGAVGGMTDGASLTGFAGQWILAADDLGNVWALKAPETVPVNPHLVKFDSDLNVLETWDQADLPTPLQVTGCGAFTVWSGILFFGEGAGITGDAYTINDDGTFTLTDPGTINAGVGAFFGNSISLGNGLMLTGNGVVSLQPRPLGIRLSQIVANLSNRSGLSNSEIDVSQLTDIVDGYIIANQGATRGMIEPLQTAYFFDAVESDTVAKFVKRGAAPSVTIGTADLGAFVGGTTPPPLATVVRTQETDLPQFISAVFLNVGADYQNGEQHAERQVTSSELAVALQLPIAMDDTKAKEVAGVNMFDAWMGRDKVTVLTPRKYVYLEPTDVIAANGYTLRVTDKAETVPGVIKLDGVTTGVFVYSQNAIAGPGLAPPPPPPPTPMDTAMLMLDLPLIHDTDNTYGYYVVMNGVSSSVWPGATLYKSIDGGGTFNADLVDTVPDTFGDCSTVLGGFGGGNIFDETNSLTVVLNIGSGDLASATRLAVLNGANLCAVGSPGVIGVIPRPMELLQFRDATLIAPRTYLLTGLLRGRRGTEYMIPSHVAAEKFVLLPTAINALGLQGEVYLHRLYRAVTSGRSLATATDVDFINYAMANLCYSPTCLGGGRFPNSDLLLQWRRRTRIGGTWHDFVDVPLSEAMESYEVRIYADGTYTTRVRLTIVSTPSFLYTAAEQTADFGSPQATVHWGVVQLGQLNYGTESRGVT